METFVETDYSVVINTTSSFLKNSILFILAKPNNCSWQLHHSGLSFPSCLTQTNTLLLQVKHLCVWVIEQREMKFYRASYGLCWLNEPNLFLSASHSRSRTLYVWVKYGEACVWLSFVFYCFGSSRNWNPVIAWNSVFLKSQVYVQSWLVYFCSLIQSGIS